MARSQVQYGSKGNDVTELQKMLNQNGYKLSVDGSFGLNTLIAVKDYQKKNGLSVDGIVGEKTWYSLTGGTTTTNSPSNTNIPAPTLSPMPTAPTYDTTTWDQSTKGQSALGAYNSAQDAVKNYGEFTYGNQAQLDSIINNILNRKDFSYDLNGDALYQQYKDKYIKQGKMAMGDAIGQASAMTGGYGNSYAQSVGQQAYQAQLENLNDIVPELWQMAYDQYNQEGQDLYNQYGMLSDDYTRAYGEYQDGYNKLMDALGIARSDYYDGRDEKWRDEEMAYQKGRDEVADEQWKKQFDATYGYSTKSYSGTTETGKKYNNGGLTNGQIKELQAALGVDADGYYGDISKKAAGDLSAEEAYEKYVVGDDGDKPPIEDYSDWDASMWRSYFEGIRADESKSAAEEELNRLISKGVIPQDMIAQASIGARGSLGH